MSENTHVILVAVTVEADNREIGETFLLRHLPRPGLIDSTMPGHPQVVEWWIAEDDRRDGSDNDSAVFVKPGAQARASRLLFREGLTPAINVVKAEPSRFEE